MSCFKLTQSAGHNQHIQGYVAEFSSVPRIYNGIIKNVLKTLRNYISISVATETELIIEKLCDDDKISL